MREMNMAITRCDLLGSPIPGPVPTDAWAAILYGRCTPIRQSEDSTVYHDTRYGCFYRIARVEQRAVNV